MPDLLHRRVRPHDEREPQDAEFGPRVSIVSNKGELLARLGGLHAGNEPGQFISPHGIAVDSQGNIYVGEVSRTAWPQLYPDVPAPDPLHSLTKLTKVR